MHKIYIDPPSKAFYNNRFLEDSSLNRDECLRPMINLKEALYQKNIEINTFDLWDVNTEPCDFYSFGMLDNLDFVSTQADITMKGFYVFEPPIVDPRLYKALPKLTSLFEQVYVHNIEGDGYSLKGVDKSKLKKLNWPQPFAHALSPYWDNDKRSKKIVVINGNHKPASHHNELYSQRIEAMAELSSSDMIDLYGRGWDKLYSRSSLWWPYIKNRKKILSIYKGACDSKFEVLSKYQFCLCFENMSMKGYMTEKLFDCLYAGTVPLYLGAPDVELYIDKEAYIDVRQFSNWHEMLDFIINLSAEDILSIKQAGKQFLESEKMKLFSLSLENDIVV